MGNMLFKQLSLIASAFMYLTRLPMPVSLTKENPNPNSFAAYFPFVGWFVGLFAALVFVGARQIFPMDVAVILSMIATVLLTGAFHEDGFADVCDGFGGGWTKEKILTIMKDSRIGAYGAIGMLLILALKFSLLRHLDEQLIPITLIAAHASSRAMAIVMTVFLPYARVTQPEGAVFKPFVADMTGARGIAAAVFGVIPFLLFGSAAPLLALVPMALVTLYLGRYFNKWIGGYTGDCCGATQQVTEIVFI